MDWNLLHPRTFVLRWMFWVVDNAVRFMLLGAIYVATATTVFGGVSLVELGWAGLWHGFLDVSVFNGLGYLWLLLVLAVMPVAMSRRARRIAAMVLAVPVAMPLAAYDLAMIGIGPVCALCARIDSPRHHDRAGSDASQVGDSGT